MENDAFANPDKQALALAHAIALQESGQNGRPNYNAVGDNGTSHGAYQWQPGNYEAAAKEAGLDPSDFSPATQDKVAYYQVKKYKDRGLDPGQIASIWNSGSPDNWKDHSGTTTINGKEIHYDTPAYVNGVKKYYQQLAASQTPSYNPKPYSTGAVPGLVNYGAPSDTATTPDSSTLGGQLTQRGQDIAGALTLAGKGAGELSKGDIAGGAMDVGSGILQTAGGLAGGLGDVVNKGLELIPGVKQVENLLGQGVGFLAKTPTGQAVAKSIQDFSDKNPELAKDIGAGFNIITAIPILRGLGVVGAVAKDAAAQALKGVAEKSFVSGFPEVIGSTKAGARFIANNPDIAKDMVDRRLVGNIENGAFNTAEDATRSWNTITDLNKQVGQILDRPEFSAVGQDGKSIAQRAIQGFTDRNGKVIEGIPQSGMTAEELIANAKKLDPNNALLWDKFEAGQANLKEINQLRSSLDSKVKKVFIGPASIDSPEVAVSKENGALLSGAMRDAVQTSAPSTAVPFNEMAKQFDIQKALELLNGKKIKPGMLSGFMGHAVGAGTGGLIGAMLGGGPTGALVGGLIGDRAAGAVGKKIAGQSLIQGVLKKTGVNAAKTSAKKVLKGAGGLLIGAGAQKATR